jgi:hypothetical protein
LRKIDLGQTISVLANIGVIAGIIFLAVELRQNNELMEVEARAASNARLTEIPEIVSTDVDLANALIRAKSGETLTESEKLRIYAFDIWNFRGQEAYFREFEAGTVESIPEDRWRRSFHSDPWSEQSRAESWSRAKASFDADFVQWIEENVVNER